MKILLVSEDVPHPSMGGLARHATTLAKALALSGHEVDFMGNRLYPLDPALGLPGRFFADLRYLFGGWKEQKLGFFNPVRRSFLARDFARSILARAPAYDVVHYHGHVPDVGAFIPRRVNFVQTRHDQGGDCLVHTRFRNGEVCVETAPRACASCMTPSPNAFQSAMSMLTVTQYRARVREAFIRHKTVFVSDMLRQNYRRTAGRGSWGDVVHNFVDRAEIIRALEKPERLPQSRLIKRLIAFAGKLYRLKGVEAFLSVMAPRLDPSTHLLVIGDGPEERALRMAYSSDRVTFLGWCAAQRTLSLMAGADVVVVPSIWEEPCATSILEGLFLGKPTHALARGGTPELKLYELYRNQLRLYANMPDLVEGVLAPTSDYSCPVQARPNWDAQHAAARFVEIYRAPLRSRLSA